MVMPNRPERACLPCFAVTTTRAAVRHENIFSILGQCRHSNQPYAASCASAVTFFKKTFHVGRPTAVQTQRDIPELRRHSLMWINSGPITPQCNATTYSAL